jgi:hypothetical protein
MSQYYIEDINDFFGDGLANINLVEIAKRCSQKSFDGFLNERDEILKSRLTHLERPIHDKIMIACCLFRGIYDCVFVKTECKKGESISTSIFSDVIMSRANINIVDRFSQNIITKCDSKTFFFKKCAPFNDFCFDSDCVAYMGFIDTKAKVRRLLENTYTMICYSDSILMNTTIVPRRAIPMQFAKLLAIALLPNIRSEELPKYISQNPDKLEKMMEENPARLREWNSVFYGS